MINQLENVIDFLNDAAEMGNKAEIKLAIKIATERLSRLLVKHKSSDNAFNDAIKYDDENPSYITGSEDGI